VFAVTVYVDAIELVRLALLGLIAAVCWGSIFADGVRQYRRDRDESREKYRRLRAEAQKRRPPC
jgi:hypothetical protein